MQCSSLVAMAKARKEKDKESQTARFSRARVGKVPLDSPTTEKGKERVRMVVRGSWSTSQKFQGHCNFCGMFGHKESDCRKKKGGGKSDAGKKGVRQVEEVPAADGGTSTGGGASITGAVKMISLALQWIAVMMSQWLTPPCDNLDRGVFALSVAEMDDN